MVGPGARPTCTLLLRSRHLSRCIAVCQSFLSTANLSGRAESPLAPPVCGFSSRIWCRNNAGAQGSTCRDQCCSCAPRCRRQARCAAAHCHRIPTRGGLGEQKQQPLQSVVLHRCTWAAWCAMRPLCAVTSTSTVVAIWQHSCMILARSGPCSAMHYVPSVVQDVRHQLNNTQ